MGGGSPGQALSLGLVGTRQPRTPIPPAAANLGFPGASRSGVDLHQGARALRLGLGSGLR